MEVDVENSIDQACTFGSNPNFQNHGNVDIYFKSTLAILIFISHST